jgi:hypothetical protein
LKPGCQPGWFAYAASPQKVVPRTQTLAGQKKTEKIRTKGRKDHKGRGMNGFEQVGIFAARKTKLADIPDTFN